MSVPAHAIDRSVDARAVLDILPDLVFLLSPEGILLDVNETSLRLLRWSRAEAIGASVFDVVHPDDVAVAISSLGTLQDKETGTPIELRVCDVDGAWHWVEIIGSNRPLGDGTPGLVCVARDITQRRMWEVAAGDVDRFQQVLHHAPSITMLLDADGVVTSVNHAFTRLLGHDPSLVVGATLATFVDEQSLTQLRESLLTVRGCERRAAVELVMRTSSRQTRLIRFDFVDELDDPVVRGIIGSGYDMSELQVVRQELEFIAGHDPLTGLANRSLLIEQLGRMLRTEAHVAVLFIDLDRFKPINDLYGHDIGDTVLRHVAARLLEVVRSGDTVARVGGDEFVALAASVADPEAARELADRIEVVLGAPYLLDVGPVKIGASVGVALSDPSSTVAGMLSAADAQMYHAKSERRGSIVPHAIERRRTAGERRNLAIELAAGLGRGEVVAYLQPVVDLVTGNVVGVEALARWNHPTRGLLRPAVFLDLVDDAGLDAALGDAVLVSACRSLRDIRGLGFNLELCVNMSLGQLTTSGLCAHIADVIEPFGLPMSKLVVEITERATLLRHVPRGCPSPEETLHELNLAGVSLSLDDFGTGHSSLNHVRRFPLSSIKVDRTFVAAMVLQPEDHAVVEVVIGLAKALGLSVVAEGVETAVQLDLLRQLGCGRAQGYYLGQPMEASSIGPWLIDRRRYGAVTDVDR